ncbi:hypothetical protein F9L16_08000 [Agarivorans sp. B2Z047]|uniref:hypothetical protein n=1 Tax=Agarivorans sp. B2Z047 TaxID=2652721 RepID=UPI00128C5A68|nr:hypothetical protein [Agarivorans sp. B2Z047]MPW28942.1 hypothetical protein [Agarivorans sp. B2Z047]UQN41499.1 hypothetical protein LQZ07_17205 [Agarivorans sp. B2Z047]
MKLRNMKYEILVVLFLVTFSVFPNNDLKMQQAKYAAAESFFEEFEWARHYLQSNSGNDSTGEYIFYVAVIDIKRCIKYDNCDNSNLDNIVLNLEHSARKGFPLAVALLEHCFRDGFLVSEVDLDKANKYLNIYDANPIESNEANDISLVQRALFTMLLKNIKRK